MRHHDDVTALILAGGAGRRMGGADKGLLRLRGKPLVQHVIDAIAPQVDTIVISANRHLDAYRRFGYPVIEDRWPDFRGPLAGIASGLAAADTRFALTLPCDGPDVPTDLAERLRSALVDASAELAIAHDGTRLQPVHLLLTRTLIAEVEAALSAGHLKLGAWAQTRSHTIVDFSDQAGCFSNVNLREDLAQRESVADKHTD